MFDKISNLITGAQKILIIQADNPDADSLGSALALEQILGELGKDTYLYCGVNTPEYLRYLSGWDRVLSQLPSQFDVSIIVDTSAMNLLGKLQTDKNNQVMHTKPCIVLDHHAETDNDITFATEVINLPDRSSTGEVIYVCAKELSWPIDTTSGGHIMQAILGDTQGLTNDSTSASTYTIMAELVDIGVNRPALEDARREFTKMDPRIFNYKADLIKRTELLVDGHLALVTVPQDEINTYSPLYNPAPLIQTDMLQTKGVMIAVVIKFYDDGHMLGSIRCNQAAPIASELALHLGGGGHTHAAGFKITDGRPLNEVKSECIRYVSELLTNLDTPDDETIQYTF